jgi:hypothetical protein
MSWMQKLDRACAELDQFDVDPWRRVLERALPANITAISTVSLCDLAGLKPTTANARLLAPTMRRMGFVPLKSRNLMPGGNRGTTVRGWARPTRDGARPNGFRF